MYLPAWNGRHSGALFAETGFPRFLRRAAGRVGHLVVAVSRRQHRAAITGWIAGSGFTGPSDQQNPAWDGPCLRWPTSMAFGVVRCASSSLGATVCAWLLAHISRGLWRPVWHLTRWQMLPTTFLHGVGHLAASQQRFRGLHGPLARPASVWRTREGVRVHEVFVRAMRTPLVAGSPVKPGCDGQLTRLDALGPAGRSTSLAGWWGCVSSLHLLAPVDVRHPEAVLVHGGVLCGSGARERGVYRLRHARHAELSRTALGGGRRCVCRVD